MTGSELRQALRRLGWTQAQAAERLGVASQPRVSEWCRGARDVPDYVARAVEAHLRIRQLEAELRELRGGEEPAEG